MQSLSVFRVKQERVSTFIFHTDKVVKPLDATEIAFAFLNHQYGGMPDREVVGSIWLNVQLNVIGIELVSIGILDGAMLRPREFFVSGLLHNASSGIVFHNHPSGNLTPSEEDINISKKLVSAGEILGIKILDSLIIAGEDTYLSLNKEGLL